ncbi:hypothetical protein FE783_29300 [Paenibacillus mesophilus]|uniref:hypothetical protein n=1 Tax=Paenibacillus mesophilus TaxID=2582849 RepID=UPI00110DDA6B|nr:hypothetical protein [Paenibacillus mesophilus]TMV45422.1 hypothetical protein FE783_29300 [Paenibacillus mesophilus]
MKRLQMLKKSLLPAALALALIVPAAAYAAGQTTPDTNSGSASKPQQQQEIKKKQLIIKHMGDIRDRAHGAFQAPMIKHRMADQQVNQHKYLELLAEKYSPDTLADWKAALTEQQSLHEQLQSLMRDQGVQDALKAEREQHQKQWKDKQEELKKQWKDKQEELKKKVESGEISKEQIREQMQSGRLPFGAAMKGGLQKALPKEAAAAMHDAMKHRQALTEAVKADNADAIRAALAPILEDVKKGNEQAAARIAKLKPSATGQTVQPKEPKQKIEKRGPMLKKPGTPADSK